MPAPALSATLRFQLAQAALSREFLFPNQRCWARLTMALAEWNLQHPGKDAKMAFVQEVQAKKSGGAGIPTHRSFDVQVSHACNPEYASASNGLGDDIIVRLAAYLSVAPDWLLYGFSRTGDEVWPAWSARYTRQGRQTLRELLIAVLADCAEQRSTPWTIIQLVCAASPQQAAWDASDIRVNNSNFIHEDAGEGPPLSQALRGVQTFIDRNHLRLDSYLARYQEPLRAEFTALVDHWHASQGAAPKGGAAIENKEHALGCWVKHVLHAAQQSTPQSPERSGQQGSIPTPPTPSPPPTPAP